MNIKKQIATAIGAGITLAFAVVGVEAMSGDTVYEIRTIKVSLFGDRFTPTEIYKFVDPDNGNVCYLSDVYGGWSISCVK